MNLIFVLIFSGLNVCIHADIVDIYLYNNKSDSIKIVDGSPTEGFDAGRPTKLIIHGYIANRNNPLIERLTNAYLAVGGYNVIVADWGPTATRDYISSRNAIRKVGLRIAKHIEALIKESGARVRDFHLVGHSLGAHVAGYAGRNLKAQISRITGLDPAFPSFTYSTKGKLSPQSAVFVDVIHTCAGFLGTPQWLGHADFYPNEGFAPQIGCEYADMLFGGTCSHFRSVYLFVESIAYPMAFPAYKCPLKPTESCDMTTPAAYMGEHVDTKARGLFYLKTRDANPYGFGLDIYGNQIVHK